MGKIQDTYPKNTYLGYVFCMLWKKTVSGFMTKYVFVSRILYYHDTNHLINMYFASTDMYKIHLPQNMYSSVVLNMYFKNHIQEIHILNIGIKYVF